MDVNEFDYYLPEKLIAQQPVPNRDESSLMVLDKATGEIEDRIFKDIIDLLDPGDLLVMNNSRVIPARLYGKKVSTGTDIEVLLLTEKEEGVWEVLVRPGKRVKKGVEISFGDNELMAKAVEYTEFGGRIMEFSYQGDFNEIIERLGELPLPPYIQEELAEPGRYQTVYARKPGSAAAPTAGLHFTPQLIKQLEEKGIDIAYITLHVGLGTFRPVKVDKVEEHQMHSEYYELDTATAKLIRQKKELGKRVISVGTTVTRTLETIAAEGEIKAKKGWTDIFIYPPYRFKVIDSLITNFHLPRSTLLMLVSAFAGKEKVLTAYKEAVNREYRFFSLGDAMFIK
ncbi:MAG: tRNA preQ1(34) S-adenosylmethionine ribosyltransferase-isomerase QueA [Firmicutes bacterium]|nr:tRNA preQ1(34) S-adenosylmethionine ribosyltransferase-isomerase QueA [Bacillota bacterium]